MSAAPWSFTWSHCHHPPPFSPQKRSKKRQWKNAAGREMPLSFSLFGMSTELLLFCVSLGILGCFCPPSSSRQSLWITVFTWGLVKAVISFPLWGGVLSGALVSCLLRTQGQHGVIGAWSLPAHSYWRLSQLWNFKSLLSFIPHRHTHLHQFPPPPSHPPQPPQSLG